VEGASGDYPALSKSFIFYWIDDDPKRGQFVDLINNFRLPRFRSARAVFFDVRKKNLTDELPAILNMKQPDLVIIDQILDKTLPGLLSLGSTAARIIREKWPKGPIVGISAAWKRNGVNVGDVLDRDKESEFEDLYAADEFSQHFTSLFVIAAGFRQLATTRLGTIDRLVKLLKPPKTDVERLKSVLPTDLKSDRSDNSAPRRISNWVRHTVMEKPGFLYNREWTANLIGLKPEAFVKVERLFEGTKFTGIFSDATNDRWWSTSVRLQLFKSLSDSESNLPWVAGHSLPRIKKSDRSVCYVCGKLYPETLGYPDASNKSWKPMHLACSQPHPQFESSLFYDQIRIMGDK
jgi:hypothetical protein